MPEEQPKQPSSSVPPTPNRPASTGQGGTSLQQVTQTLQQKWEQVQPGLKAQSAKVLRLTIRSLETAAEKLETDTPQSPSRAASTQETSSTPTQPTGQSAQLSFSALLKRSRPFLAKLQTWATAALEKIQPQLARLQAWWTKTLPQIRNRLPASLNEKLSDRALTNLAIAGVVFLVLTTNSVLSPPKSRAPEVAKVPISQRVPPAELTAPPELSAPEAEIPVAIAPPEETAVPLPEPIVVEPEIPTIADAPEVPADLVAPEPPEPVEVTPPAPIEPPAPVLSPQEQILASIQAKVAEVTNQYAENLVQSVQTNLVGNRLTVKLSDRWYNLQNSQQDQLASGVLAKAKTLDFTKLEITDAEGKLLARTPVVGSGMVILQRGNLATAS
ncbi:hypothetical protein [Trichocoleus sp. FACHB-262]|uniref:hypothetical protein n=1 Tax=Trichocoleus sp. FACHB-262 TaxID=2692869 RepID=UPI001687E7BD|nr:hypothetical protein [Trichocoleus sp. FACHB-262]